MYNVNLSDNRIFSLTPVSFGSLGLCGGTIFRNGWPTSQMRSATGLGDHEWWHVVHEPPSLQKSFKNQLGEVRKGLLYAM